MEALGLSSGLCTDFSYPLLALNLLLTLVWALSWGHFSWNKASCLSCPVLSLNWLRGSSECKTCSNNVCPGSTRSALASAARPMARRTIVWCICGLAETQMLQQAALLEHCSEQQTSALDAVSEEARGVTATASFLVAEFWVRELWHPKFPFSPLLLSISSVALSSSGRALTSQSILE